LLLHYLYWIGLILLHFYLKLFTITRSTILKATTTNLMVMAPQVNGKQILPISYIVKSLWKNTEHMVFDSDPMLSTCTLQRQRVDEPAIKVHAEKIFFDVLFINQRRSPKQISLKLTSLFIKSHELRVSSESIYKCIDTQPVWQLKKNLKQAMLYLRNKCVPKREWLNRGEQILDMLSTHLLPPHADDRLFTSTRRTT
jgi:hypothetical protein